MNAPDYHDITTSISEIIAKTSKPLADAQKMALVGSVSIWLLQRDQRIEKLEASLRNCLLLAMRAARQTTGTVETDWRHIIRFCTEAGVKPSPLRSTD